MREVSDEKPKARVGGTPNGNPGLLRNLRNFGALSPAVETIFHRATQHPIARLYNHLLINMQFFNLLFKFLFCIIPPTNCLQIFTRRSMRTTACAHRAGRCVSGNRDITSKQFFEAVMVSPHDAYVFAVSIIGWVIIAMLVGGEVNNFLTPKLKEHMVVDTSLGQRLRINLNITFHALTCAEVRRSIIVS